MAKADLTAQRLRELLHYDSDTGLFTNRVWRGGTSRVGTVAGGTTTGGYKQIGVDGVIYKAHRLAWLYVHGCWPEADIDHINGNTSDNRIANLRDVTRSVNLQNVRTSRKADKGIPLGASWSKATKSWAAYIRVDGRTRYLGRFDTAQKAHEAYVIAKRTHHQGCTI